MGPGGVEQLRRLVFLGRGTGPSNAPNGREGGKDSRLTGPGSWRNDSECKPPSLPERGHRVRCIGRTQSLRRCKREAARLFCRDHRIQPWTAVFFVSTVVGTYGTIYWDVIRPFASYLAATVAHSAGVGASGHSSNTYLAPDHVREWQTDAYLSYVAAKNRRALRARSVSIVVSSVQTGQVVGYGSDNGRGAQEFLNLKIEPGHLVAPIIIASALELGAISDTTWLRTGESAQFGSFTLHDAHPIVGVSAESVLTAGGIIAVARVAERMGAESVCDYLRRFGLLPDCRMLGPNAIWLPTVANGHGFTTTPRALLDAYRILASSRKAISGMPGVVRPDVSMRIREWLADAIESGPGKSAIVRHIGVSGEGAAHSTRDSSGSYSQTQVVYDMAAIIPTYDPQYIILVYADKSECAGLADPWPCGPIIGECTRFLLQK